MSARLFDWIVVTLLAASVVFFVVVFFVAGKADRYEAESAADRMEQRP